MLIMRLAKIAMVASIAAFATLVAFGNITDYGTNFVFVEHVLSMDSVFPNSTITYRAITSPALHHAAYWLIIAAEAGTAAMCWIGAFALLRARHAPAASKSRGTSLGGAPNFVASPARSTWISSSGVRPVSAAAASSFWMSSTLSTDCTMAKAGPALRALFVCR